MLKGGNCQNCHKGSQIIRTARCTHKDRDDVDSHTAGSIEQHEEKVTDMTTSDDARAEMST